jgi:hypothetical protein
MRQIAQGAVFIFWPVQSMAWACPKSAHARHRGSRASRSRHFVTSATQDRATSKTMIDSTVAPTIRVLITLAIALARAYCGVREQENVRPPRTTRATMVSLFVHGSSMDKTTPASSVVFGAAQPSPRAILLHAWKNMCGRRGTRVLCRP